MPSRTELGPSVAVLVMLVTIVIFAPLLVKLQAVSLAALLNTDQKKISYDLKQTVWVNPRSGYYYCAKTRFYGKMKPGFYLRQGTAMQRGYRPAEGGACP